MSVTIGDKAPDFTLPTDGNGSVTLSELRGKPVVLYFYPKDDTSGCTAEACGFRDSFPDFGRTGAVGHRRVARSGRLARQVQAEARAAVHPRLRREPARSPSNTASGSRKACTAASTWASTAAPF